MEGKSGTAQNKRGLNHNMFRDGVAGKLGVDLIGSNENFGVRRNGCWDWLTTRDRCDAMLNATVRRNTKRASERDRACVCASARADN